MSFKNIKLPEETEKALSIADCLWEEFRRDNSQPKQVVNTADILPEDNDYDVIICGGNLGIFLATALQMRGHRVAVLEKGILQGREQEWNISRKELNTLLNLDILPESSLQEAIFTEYNPARIGFYRGYQLWVRDVLNIGVSPRILIAKTQERFRQLGGVVVENSSFEDAIIGKKGVRVKTNGQTLTCRLLIDCMGHFSPIVKQVRKNQKPGGVCLVVGSCGKGFRENDTGDLIYTFTPIINQYQYFWEAFPAKDGRTTYLFTYTDAKPERISLRELMGEYLRLLPEYQNIALEEIEFKRFLFGFFPAYYQSPLQMPWDRIIAVGDSSGMQSPVSFGGFAAMLRHLPRLTAAIDEALQGDYLSRQDLALIQPYQPNLSVTWLFQKTMMVADNKQVSGNEINQLMSAVFQVMDNMGEEVLKPFLQDVIQFAGLTKTLPQVDIRLVLPLLPDFPTLLDWLKHYLNLGIYTGLYPLALSLKPLTTYLPPHARYYWQRYLDMWQYGSGMA
ncbi:MAG: FAD-binding oxidoreductase [Geminocystis sp.]|nr:FAD-binding oxidoreductase [Geminocystis sp.]MCS7148429.1 FAD-binding oxidoreductase [Geminocystis sp.]MDW8115983.1 FAD-binding oxidoreductase [Geminocystis sp.]MDW8463677.1 FAD-binding oxidoreductase [Geminocystis sp.]